METLKLKNSKKLKCCEENVWIKIEVSRARCPSKLCCSLAFITRRNSEKISSKSARNSMKTVERFFNRMRPKECWKIASSFENLAENAKKVDTILLKYSGLSGAKACKSCRSRQELSNEYFLAKFGVDTEENEPCKVWSFGWKLRVRFDIESFN